MHKQQDTSNAESLLSNFDTVKVPTTASGRQTHTQVCIKLTPVIFLSTPLPSLWDSDSLPVVKHS